MIVYTLYINIEYNYEVYKSMGLEAKLGKIHYTKLKFSDQRILTSAQTSLDRAKRQGSVQSQVFENNYKLNYNNLVQGYETRLSELRTQLSTETNQQTRENLQQQITQIQTEKAIALAQLQDEKDSTSEMYKASVDQQETYWNKLVEAKKSDIEVDNNMIKYFSDKLKEYFASMFGGNSSSQSS